MTHSLFPKELWALYSGNSFVGSVKIVVIPWKNDHPWSHDPTMIFHINPSDLSDGKYPTWFPRKWHWVNPIFYPMRRVFPTTISTISFYPEFVSSLVWVKKNSKPPMTGNGAPIPPWNGDDWGMVHGIAQLSLVAASTRPRTWDARSSRSRRAAPASRGFHLGATKGWNMANWKMMNNSPMDWHLNGGFQKWGTPESSI